MVQDIVGTKKEPVNETPEDKAARLKEEKKAFNRIMKLFDGALRLRVANHDSM